MDSRIKSMAKVLAHYSLRLKENDRLIIKGNGITLPLMEAVFAEAISVGAFPTVRINEDSFTECLYKNGNQAQLEYISDIERATYESCDAMLTIWGENNTKSFTKIDPKAIQTSRRARKDLTSAFMHRIGTGTLKWCGTQFPTHASAQDAEMSLEEYETFVYEACMLHLEDPVAHWKAVSEKQDKLCMYLNEVSVLRFVAMDTDLTVEVSGRKWINCDGKENFPDGEVFTTPHKLGVNGTVRFSYPAIYEGKEVEDVKLVFHEGKIIEATATKGEAFLKSVIETDEGAARVGEIAIGTNYGIQTFSKNILFDEKIGGTFHLAIGAGFIETGGNNESAIHWDMICDMKQGGQIFADGQLIYENGQFKAGGF